MPETITEPTEEVRESGVQNAINRFANLVTFEDKKPPTEVAPAKPVEKPAEVVPDKPTEAAKPADLTPPEPKPILDDAPPGNVVGKAAESWNSFKTKANKEIAAREARIAQLTQEVETAKQSAKPVEVTKAPEFEELNKRYQELDSKMKVVAIERHPAFVKYFGDKTAIALETAKSVVGAELAPRLERILKTGDPELRAGQIRELASELEPYAQAELATAMSQLRAIDAERNAEIAKAGQAYDTLQSKTKAEQDQTLAQRKATADQTKSAALALARSTMSAFQPKEGDEAHNAAVKNNEAIVASFFDGTIDPKLMTAIPALAAEAMHLRQSEIPRLESELKKRDAIIAQYQSSSPKIVPGGEGDKKDVPPVGNKFISTFNSLWQPPK